ncbi:MAG: Asp23/Gls24 family envelope stress response protein [Victivallales bacterium]|nr:Asp23/Gls24 family envelope stress response protein [Victivallales bacterium]
MKQAKKSVNHEKEQVEKPANAEANFIEKPNEFGKIRLTDTVIVSIIKKAVCNVSGVTRLSGSSFMDSIAGMISSQRAYDRSIEMVINEDSTLEIDVKINVAYGVNIPNVATKVQNTIRDEIKNLLGLRANKINIKIQEIEAPAKESENSSD